MWLGNWDFINRFLPVGFGTFDSIHGNLRASCDFLSWLKFFKSLDSHSIPPALTVWLTEMNGPRDCPKNRPEQNKQINNSSSARWNKFGNLCRQLCRRECEAGKEEKKRLNSWPSAGRLSFWFFPRSEGEREEERNRVRIGNGSDA
jgi:hypothetical protein